MLTVDTWYVFSCVRTAIARDLAKTWDGIYDNHSSSLLHQMRSVHYVDYFIREREQLPLTWSLNERENVQRKFVIRWEFVHLPIVSTRHTLTGYSEFHCPWKFTGIRMNSKPKNLSAVCLRMAESFYESPCYSEPAAIDEARILLPKIEAARCTANNNNCFGRKRTKFIHWFMFIRSNTHRRNDFRTQKIALLIN